MKKFIIIFLFCLVFCDFAKAEIYGSTACPAGELVILNCNRPAVWKVFPPEYSGSYAVSDDGRTLYFASSKRGRVVFFAASTINCLPYTETHILINGIDTRPGISTPAPPIVPTIVYP